MATLSDAHNAAEFARLARLPRQIRSRMRKVVESQAAAQVQDMRRQTSGRPGLISRTGGFRNSFSYSIEDGPSGPVARAYTSGTAHRTRTLQPFSGVQEGVDGRDTVIRARLSQWLTVPLPANVGASGLPKYQSARDLRSAGLTRIRKTKSGQYLILVKEGTEWNAMWVLKRAVSVPARLRFMDSFKDRDSERRAHLDQEIRDVIKAN